MKKEHSFKGRVLTILLFSLLVGVIFQGCAHHFAFPEEQFHAVYMVESAVETLIEQSVPAMLVYGYADNYNRIGRPSVEDKPDGTGNIRIDTGQPTVYVMKRTFATRRATYTNLIYRIHFPKVPYSLVPFNLTAGNNVGVMVIITLNQNNQPVLVTTVGTCGCYKAFVPTDYLIDEALPASWPSDGKQDIYGELLPTRLAYQGVQNPTLLIHLRPEVHRVMDIEVVPFEQLRSPRYFQIPMEIAPMASLEQLPAGKEAVTSFYYEDGWLKGHVKGSTKPFEMIFMSLFSLDLFVGSDKAYADPEVSGNPFYTSLKPWRRNDSNMWNFARFLDYWGWRL